MSQLDERYKKGMEILNKVTDEKGINMIKRFSEIHPDFEEMMVSFGYGDIWSRDELDLKQRALITLSSLITQGAFEALRFHVKAALHVGVKPKEIVELVVHCAAYVGFPKAVTAFPIVMEIFEQQNIKLDDKEG
jgi:4-carboxymuconolactone decarboxylase